MITERPEKRGAESRSKRGSDRDDPPKPLVEQVLLNIPCKYLISHVLHTPHYTALWDVQIIYADEGGLDQLEYDTTGRGPKRYLYRAMTQSTSYYNHLRDLVPQVRRFDYPPPPDGYGLWSTNLVPF